MSEAEELQRIRSQLMGRRRELLAEVAELAQPVRAPGVQMQFGKRAGDHTSDAVLQMTRSVTAGQLSHLANEIDRALEKLEEGSYGRCDVCGGEIVPERLEALPWAVLCVTCKAAADRSGER
jgi:DnaK suppressor protein